MAIAITDALRRKLQNDRTMHKQHNHQPSSRHKSNLPRIHHQISPPMHRALAEDHGGEEGAVGAAAHPRRVVVVDRDNEAETEGQPVRADGSKDV